MTITLDLPAERVQQLTARVAARGQSLADYLLMLADQDADWFPNTDPERLATMRALWALAPANAPILSDESIRRETMYAE